MSNASAISQKTPIMQLRAVLASVWRSAPLLATCCLHYANCQLANLPVPRLSNIKH